MPKRKNKANKIGKINAGDYVIMYINPHFFLYKGNNFIGTFYSMAEVKNIINK